MKSVAENYSLRFLLTAYHELRQYFPKLSNPVFNFFTEKSHPPPLLPPHKSIFWQIMPISYWFKDITE